MQESTAYAIETTGLMYCYPEGDQVLGSIDFIVPLGQSVGIIGGNGSGKTTLLMLLAGQITSYGNLIKIMGQSITGKTNRWLLNNVRLVHEDPEEHFKRKTVYYNIALGAKIMGLSGDAVDKRVYELLEMVGSTHLAKRKHDSLSTGEKKKMSIAAVLSTEPKVILLDEPTISLDPRNTRWMINLIAGLKSTKVVATHNLELVKNACERTIILDSGKVAADGPTADILADYALLDSYGLMPKDGFDRKTIKSLLDLDL